MGFGLLLGFVDFSQGFVVVDTGVACELLLEAEVSCPLHKGPCAKDWGSLIV